MLMPLLGFSLAPDLELEFETGLDQKWNFEAERILPNDSNSQNKTLMHKTLRNYISRTFIAN